MRLAVDFDGTVVDDQYPGIGEEVPHAASTLRELVRRGHRITLNTMRSGVLLDEAVQWFTQREIPLWGVNRDPAQLAWTESPKVHADLYIDDRALGCPLARMVIFDHPVVDWVAVLALINLVEQGNFGPRGIKG